MTPAAGAPLRAQDLALWRHLAAGHGPLTVVARTPHPAWLAALPRAATVVPDLDAAAAAGLGRGTVVLCGGPELLAPDALAALQQANGEILHRHGDDWRILRATPAPAHRPLRDLLARALPALGARLGVVRLRRPFRADGGHCRWASLGGLRPPPPHGDRTAVLFEDGRPLPLGDCVHDEIRRLGGGRHSVWERGIYFSSADGSDPETNGRSYEVRIVARRGDGSLAAPALDEAAFAERFARCAAGRSAAPPLPRRVLLLISSLGPGGAERQFANLANGLAARGHEVGIASLDGFHGAAGHYLPLLADGIARLDLTSAAKSFRPDELERRQPGALELLQRLPDLFGAELFRAAVHTAAFRPDVLHCALDKSNLLGAIAGVLTGVPRIVLSLRNVNPTHFPYLDVPWFLRWYRHAAAVPGLVLSANSRAGAADYADWIGVPRPRVHTVHNGLDPAAMPVPADADVQALRAELGIAKDAPVLAGVFRLSPEKRPFLWLDVIARLRLRFPALVALHVGDGPEREAAAARARELGVAGAVRWLGRRPDPLRVLRAADLLLLVSTFEGIPNVALEAQWLERPVVCTDAGGSAEAVHDGVTGVVVPRPDAGELAAACERLLADPGLRARCGRAGRDLVATRFGVDRMVDGSLALYGGSATAQ